MFWESRTGGNASYVYGGDLNGDGGTSNDLLYVPTDVSEMNFQAYTQTIGSGCFIPLPFAALTTNERGAGSARGTVTLNPDATRRQVLLEIGSQPALATAL